MNARPDSEILHAALKRHFGFDRFLEGQEEAVRAVTGGRDALVVMPTGSGKSLCYQLSALVLDGTAIVVSPLIALMKDQCDALAARGIPAACINSSLSPSESAGRLAGLRAGAYRLVYIAPERFRNRRFAEAFKGLKVSLLAVDEAHCISQWGHDFRPDYLRLRQVVQALAANTRVMALTATATPEVRVDIVKHLGLGEGGRGEPLTMVHGFARPNLVLSVTRAATHAEKLRRVVAALENYPTGLVYCATRKQTERVHGMLRGAGVAAEIYHGGLADDERQRVQDRFIGGETPVVVATNAFGMGVDRADLRAVLHWDIPGSVEAYYQEVGRAGRDGKAAWCELLYNFADVRTQEFFLEGANPARETIEAVWRTVRAACEKEPVTLPVTDWAAQVGHGTNEMAVRTAMAMLERAGLIQRETAPGQRVYTTAIVPGADLSAMREQFAHLERKRRFDEQKIQIMLKYVNTRSCRHAFILSYFGEPAPAARCGGCDRCGAAHAAATREPTEEEWVVVQKILSCVARMQGRFGVRRVVQVLMGSRVQQVLEWKLDALSTYGLLQAHPEPYVRAVLEELIRDGCAEVSTGEYPVVTITSRGREVALRRVAPRLAWPARGGLPRKGAAAAPKKGAAQSAVEPDPDLAKRLRAWRASVSGAAGVPAYTVMNNRTLDTIAAERPASAEELEAIYGMGPARVQRYGRAILEIVLAAPPGS